MKRVFIILIATSLLISQQVSTYKIKAELKPDKKVVEGWEKIIWKNASSKPTEQLWFHLYLNAFRKGSTFMEEMGGMPEKWKKHPEWWGEEKILSLKVEGQDLTSAIKFVSPDDGNPEDRTVAVVELPFPVNPGQQIEIEIKFRTKLPKLFARAGYGRDYFMVAQWFPKLGVLQEEGWNCHQYHRSSEFFADFSNYEVEITVPSRFRVAASGQLVEKRKKGNKTTYLFREEKIHDFAWAADADFVEIKERFSTPNQPEVEIALFIQPDHLRLADRYMKAIKYAISFFSEKLGPYPYKRITVVDPDITGLRSGGMEYPTLITGMSFYALPRGIKFEMVVIHEFGHQYWYGMVANNEFEEAWLDEGINTFFEMEAMKAYEPLIDFPFFRSYDRDRLRLDVIRFPSYSPVICPSWKHFPTTYGVNSYAKPAIILTTWKNLMGEKIFWKAIRTYFERYKFHHPRSEDFFAVMNEVSGKDWSWFYKPLFYRPGKVNWKVWKVKDREVILARDGLDIELPVQVEVRLEDGTVEKFTWQKGKWLKKKFPKKVVEVVLDPQEKIPIDSNPFDNFWRSSPGLLVSRFAFKLVREFQEILYLLMP